MAPVPDLSGGQHFDDLAAQLEKGHLVDASVLDPLDVDAVYILSADQLTDDLGELIFGHLKHLLQLGFAHIPLRQFLLLAVPMQISPEDVSGLLFSFHLCSY